MAAGELSVESGARRVIIFHVVDIVGLRIETDAVGIPVLDDLIEDVFPLKQMDASRRTERQVQHRPVAYLPGILVVGSLSQRYALVVGYIVRTIERILHIQQCPVAVREIQCRHKPHLPVTYEPGLIVSGTCLKVGNGMYGLNPPVVVQTACQRIDSSFKSGITH